MIQMIIHLFLLGIAVHEMMHALGYYHEQSRSDRDQYVTINLSNVRSGMEHNFDKRTDTTDQVRGIYCNMEKPRGPQKLSTKFYEKKR